MIDLYGNEVKKKVRKKRRDSSEHVGIQMLHERNNRILEMKHQGLSNGEVAELAGVTPQTVCNTVNSTIGQGRLEELNEKRTEEIVKVDVEVESRLRKSFDVLDDVLDNGNHGQKLKAVDMILLKLGGYEAPKQIHGKIMHGHVANPELLDALKASGKKAAEDCGDLVVNK